MSAGTLVLGLLNGLTVGLLAVGLVLVYKSNKFLNLAHAQLGTMSALLLAKWVIDSGWSWWAAFVLAVAVGLGMGLAVERFLVGPLRRRKGSALRLLLLSLAASELLLALTFVPRLQPNPSRSQLYPQPFTSHLRVGGVALTGMSVLTAVLVPLLVAALAVFMRYTLVGRQIRAAANNQQAARLCGISVDRMSAITWGIAGALSAVSAVLQAPTQPTFNAAALGPYLLMLTLGAAAFGAFVSLPAALAGGVVLGEISQIVVARTSNASDGELAVFVAILLVVFVRGRAISRVFSLAGGAVDAVPVTRVPDALRSSSFVRHGRLWLGLAGLAIASIMPSLPYFDSEGHRFLLVLILIYALLGVGLTALVGWGGQVSLGHFAVVGLGAYMAARWSAHSWSLPAMISLSALIGALLMVAIGVPALRVGGLTLAVTTLGFGVVAADWLFHQGWAASSRPFVNIMPAQLGPGLGTPSSELSLYYVALGVLVLGVAAAVALRRSAPARLVIAVRDNEPAASAFGITPASVKLAVLALSGLFAGAAGVLWGEAWRVASPAQFSPDFSVALIAIPVIGGLGSISGAVVAAAVLYGTSFFVGPLVTSLFGNFGRNLGFQLFLAGSGQLAVLMAYPTGLAGAVQVRWQTWLDRRAASLDSSTAAAVTPDALAAVNGSTSPDRKRVVGLVAQGGEGEKRRDDTDGHGLGAAFARRIGWDGEPGALPLVAEGVRVHFGGVAALDLERITVRAGEIVGLIGPNGAGKTTLMNVISGVQAAKAGSVKLFGHEVADLPPDFRAALGVTRSFQDASLFAGLTVTETIQVPLSSRRKVGVLGSLVWAPWVRAEEFRSRERAREIIARFGLDPWRDVLTQELSTGTRRICDLAAQVAAEPRLILLDEPTGGVAQREAEAFGPLLRRIRDELDCAVLIVEHDMPLLMGLCDRVYAMELGRVIAEGTPQEIRHDPLVVASYLGSNDAAISRSGTTVRRARSRRAATIADGAN